VKKPLSEIPSLIEDVPTVVYLLHYKNKKKPLYKVGITKSDNVNARINRLEASINKVFNKFFYSVILVDKIEFTNKHDALRVERLFHSYRGLTNPLFKDKKNKIEKIDGYTEILGPEILEKWNYFKEYSFFDPIGLNPRNIVEYCIEVKKERWHEAESEILISLPDSINYSRHVIKGKWEECEKLLLSKNFDFWENPNLLRPDIHDYALIRNERWKDYEKKLEVEFINSDYYRIVPYITEYCRKYQISSLSKIEDLIINNYPYFRFPIDYFRIIGSRRNKLFEKNIISKMKDNHENFIYTDRRQIFENYSEEKKNHYTTVDNAIKYCREIIGGRWVEIEKYITPIPKLSLQYCITSHKEFWRILESLHPKYFKDSASFAILKNKRSSRIENSIINNISVQKDLPLRQINDFSAYLNHFKIKQWDEFEKYILHNFEDVSNLKNLDVLVMLASGYSESNGDWIAFDNTLEKLLLEGQLNEKNYIILNYFMEKNMRNNNQRDEKLENMILNYVLHNLEDVSNLKNLNSLVRFAFGYSESNGDWIAFDNTLEKLLIEGHLNEGVYIILNYFMEKNMKNNNQRDEKLENMILNYCPYPGQYIYQYSKECIKGRWVIAEGKLLNNPRIAVRYAKFIIKGRWPDLENALINIIRTGRNKRINAAAHYAHEILKENWPKANIFLSRRYGGYSNDRLLYDSYIYYSSDLGPIPNELRKDFLEIIYS